MNRTKWIPVLIVGALLIAAVGGVFAYQTARAATSQAVARNGFASGAFDVLGHGGRGFGGGFSAEDLANALGITVDELSTANQEARDAALDQAVQQGLITQAQADQIRSGGNAFPLGGRWMEWLSQNGIDYDALLADALGISEADLQAAYTEAFNARVDQAVTDGRITQEQADLVKGRYALYKNEGFRMAMQSAFEAAVRQAVSAGVITQAQADLILQNQGELGFPGGRGFDGPGAFGGGRGGHGGRGGERFFEPDSDAPGSVPTEPTETPSGGA
jgi:hypothetical protein